jgi:DNA recombination protein RmuC
VEATKKSIDAAAKKFDEVGTRTRAIQRKLRDVQELPAPVAPTLLDAAESDDDTDPLTPDRML